MADKNKSEDDHVAALVRGRKHLLEQIRVSQETIERSKELTQQIDKVLAKSPVKP
jgi:hypothetical protein